MAEQMRPSSPQQAPNPANSYERADPKREAGQGRLENNKSTPTDQRDQIQETVNNRQDPRRQINAQDNVNAGANADPARDPDHSMFDEEPTDPDFAPQDIQDPQRKRQPRIGGKGGTPDEGESTRK